MHQVERGHYLELGKACKPILNIREAVRADEIVRSTKKRCHPYHVMKLCEIEAHGFANDHPYARALFDTDFVLQVRVARFLLFPCETVLFVRCTCSRKNLFPCLFDSLNCSMFQCGASIFAER